MHLGDHQAPAADDIVEPGLTLAGDCTRCWMTRRVANNATRVVTPNTAAWRMGGAPAAAPPAAAAAPSATQAAANASVGSELWRAAPYTGVERVIPPGATVDVLDLRGLTVLVCPADDGDQREVGRAPVLDA